ncbi:MAG: 16S rRNA (guanine(966)-N(2))-methyltransferase RsmD, partial [Gemmatimonadetes bacterium]|nr:16S rRNA (guanine(966)-N(2))-methyltransferase RsmD [Gemmatimonadota bacterium]
AGRWRGRSIQAPPGRGTRPTADRVREAWMSALQPELPGASVVDLFAGSGALGLEALSRGAARVVFVERSAAALRALTANIERLDAVDHAQVVRADALAYAAALEPLAFDLALADPPYGRRAAEALTRLFARRPFARWLWVEHRTGDPVPELPGARTRRYGDTALTSIPAPP